MSERDNIRTFMATATRETVSLVTRRLSLAALAGVVMRTPVDTGRARGGWQTSIGTPKGGDPVRYDKSGQEAITNGAAAIGTHKDFQQIVIENNVPYISRLNDGSSKQAPAGYVELTLASLGIGTEREPRE